MNSAQIEEQIIQTSKGLPAEILQEVLDFIQFLKLKRSSVKKDSVQTLLSEFNNSEAMHLEDEFSDYKFLYPHEYRFLFNPKIMKLQSMFLQWCLQKWVILLKRKK